ncbi:MAG: hypothetical protein ACE5HS_20150 [bacterium]
MTDKLFPFIFVFVCCMAPDAGLYPENYPGDRISKQCGVSWVAGAVPVTVEDFQPLLKSGVNWIVQTPFGWQRNFNSPKFELVTKGRIYWGETDEGLEITTRLAKSVGIKTLLKPHIWLSNRSNGKWRAQIEMDSEADWRQWFASYEKFILHYARLAQRNQIAALCVGVELHITVLKRESDWRKIIAAIREVYNGKLTYAANWFQEFEDVKFWDALDYIGIQAYFPLSQMKNPDVEELMKGWQPHFKALENISQKYQKPILFTEIGYKSSADTAIKPWEWPRRNSKAASEDELQTQANCYEAFFRTFWQHDWCVGAYFWKWFPKLKSAPNRLGRGYTPQFKPAEQVLTKWYCDLDR